MDHEHFMILRHSNHWTINIHCSPLPLKEEETNKKHSESQTSLAQAAHYPNNTQFPDLESQRGDADWPKM